jgi:hypothetical protein
MEILGAAIAVEAKAVFAEMGIFLICGLTSIQNPQAAEFVKANPSR